MAGGDNIIEVGSSLNPGLLWGRRLRNARGTRSVNGGVAGEGWVMCWVTSLLSTGVTVVSGFHIVGGDPLFSGEE